MVGDGLNDAPVMARADVSFAIGDGPALTRSHADFVLLSGRLADVAEARAIARRAMRIVRQNLAWAVAYNATCVPLALLGWFPPWAAGLGMAASSLFVVLNALRIDRVARAALAAAERDSTMDILFLLVPLSVLLVFALMARVRLGAADRPVRRPASARARGSSRTTPTLTRDQGSPLSAPLDTPRAA